MLASRATGLHFSILEETNKKKPGFKVQPFTTIPHLYFSEFNLKMRLSKTINHQ